MILLSLPCTEISMSSTSRSCCEQAVVKAVHKALRYFEEHKADLLRLPVKTPEDKP